MPGLILVTAHCLGNKSWRPAASARVEDALISWPFPSPELNFSITSSLLPATDLTTELGLEFHSNITMTSTIQNPKIQ